MKKIILFLAFMNGAHAAEVGVVLSNMSDKFVTYLREGVERYAQEDQALHVTLADAAGDAAIVINQIDNFIAQKVDAVVMQPTDRKIVKAVGKKLKEAGIPLVVMNHYPEEDALPYLSAYIGSREREAGLLQAEALVRLLNGQDAEVGILLGPLGLEAQIERTEGNKEVLQRYPNIRVVAEQEGRWDRATAMRIVEDWLQAHPNMNVILANNDEMAIGAWLAAEKLGKKDADIWIAGIDATPDALALLGQGLDLSIYQDARKQGYEALRAAKNIIEKQEVTHTLWIPFETVLPQDKALFEQRY